EREELHGRPVGRDSRDHRLAAAVGEMDVEQHDVGIELADQRDGLGDAAGLADHLEPRPELAADAGAEEGVVVDAADAHQPSCLGIVSPASVPSPGSDVTLARPPARSIRASTDSERPRRSAATSARLNPTPRSRTNTEIAAGSTST